MKIYSSALRGNCSELFPLKSQKSLLDRITLLNTPGHKKAQREFCAFCGRLESVSLGFKNFLHRRLLRFDDDDRIRATVPVIFSGGIDWII